MYETKKCHAYEISFMEVTRGGKESRCQSPPRVTLIIYQKSSACMNFLCHSKPSRPFPTVYTVDIFTLSLAVSLF